MKTLKSRSLTLPIVLASITVPLGIFILVFWIIVLVQNQELSEQVSANIWLMVSGIVFIGIIIAVLVMLTVFLSREILEGRKQTRFIDSVTHELKSPLAAIKLCVQTLNRRKLPIEKQNALYQMMIDDINRLNLFIDDILEASRLASGEEHRINTLFSLNEVVERCIHQVRSRYRLEEGTIKKQIPESIQLDSNETALEMVLRNLLDNAVKYSKEEINVEIVATPQAGSKIHISITDNGIGLTKYQLKRIFERFYRAPTEKVKNRRGTGIGLYVAAQLIKSLGGKLKAASEGEGKGSDFFFQLPLHNK